MYRWANIFKAKTTYTLRLRNMETLSVFYSVNAANVFRPHYARKISKRNNHWRQKSLSTLSRLRVNHIIIKTVPKFSKCFPSILKRKAGVSKFLRFEEGFWKAPFSWQKTVDGKPIRRKKPQCVSNFSGVVWAGSYHVVGRSVLVPKAWKMLWSVCRLVPHNILCASGKDNADIIFFFSLECKSTWKVFTCSIKMSCCLIKKGLSYSSFPFKNPEM